MIRNAVFLRVFALAAMLSIASAAQAQFKLTKETKGFALLVHDPDAPTGGAGWWHWVVINLPAATTELPKGAGKVDGKVDGSNLPPGVTSLATDFGTPGYGGPCLAAGDKPHRYNFTLYALMVDKLDV